MLIFREKSDDTSETQNNQSYYLFIKTFTTKLILKNVLYNKLIKELFERNILTVYIVKFKEN